MLKRSYESNIIIIWRDMQMKILHIAQCHRPRPMDGACFDTGTPGIFRHGDEKYIASDQRR